MNWILNSFIIATQLIMLVVASVIVMADPFAIYDQVTIVMSLVWAMVNWVFMVQPTSSSQFAIYQWLAQRGVHRPHLMVSGLGLVVIGIIRHALQVQWLYLEYMIYIDSAPMIWRYAHVMVTTWFIGWSYIVASVWPKLDMRTILKENRREFIGLGVIMVIASLLRFYQLGMIPNILNGDEGLIGWWAASLFVYKNPFGFVFGAIDGVGTTYLYFKAMIFSLFGQNGLTVRLLPALAGVFSVATNYWFARQLFGTRVAVFTAIMLVFAHTHIHFSRQVAVSYIYSTLFMPVYLWGVWQVVATRRLWPAVVVAFALMLHVNFYLDAWAWAVFLVILVGAWAIVDRQAIVQAICPLTCMFALVLLGFAPMIIWSSQYPAEFFSRMSSDGSITTGWLTREAALYGISEFAMLYTLFEAAILAFLSKPFVDFYHANVPILDVISAVVFIFGLILVHAQMGTRRMLLILGWFWGGVTALAVLTIPISTYHYRLFAVVPVVYLIIAYAYDVLLRRVDISFGMAVSRVLSVVILGYFAIQNVQIYRTQFVEVCRYGGDLRTQQAGVLSNHLFSLDDPEAIVLIHGNLEEFHYGPWKTMDFMNPGMQFINIDINTDTREYLAQGRSVYVVVVPEFNFMLDHLSNQYNNAKVVDLLHCDQPILSIMKASSVR